MPTQAHPVIEVSNSGWVSGTIVDYTDTPLQPTTLTLTIYDKETLTIINGRNASALVPGTDAPSGVVGFQLAIADQALADGDKTEEIHIVRLDFTWPTNNAGHGIAMYKVVAAPDYVTP